jgi:hypothetical protein
VLGLSAWPAETVIRSAGAILTGGGG